MQFKAKCVCVSRVTISYKITTFVIGITQLQWVRVSVTSHETSSSSSLGNLISSWISILLILSQIEKKWRRESFKRIVFFIVWFPFWTLSLLQIIRLICHLPTLERGLPILCAPLFSLNLCLWMWEREMWERRKRGRKLDRHRWHRHSLSQKWRSRRRTRESSIRCSYFKGSVSWPDLCQRENESTS